MRRLMLVALLLGACDNAGQNDQRGEVADTTSPASAEATQPEERLPSDRIYYELTRYDWYARGEPLVHEERSYQPVGSPLAAPLSQMQRAGEYGGVEYYRRAGDTELLYVPVFDGYWLAFRSQATARAD